MSKQLNPGDVVICEVKPALLRRGIFVRYIVPRSWPRKTDDRRRCMVQFKHNSFPTPMNSDLVRKDNHHE